MNPQANEPDEEIRQLSLWPPYPHLIGWGEKQNETRGWATGYRGLVAIHATKRDVPAGNIPESTEWRFCHAIHKHTGKRLVTLKGLSDQVPELPRGAIIAVARLRDVLRITALGSDDPNDFWACCMTASGETERLSLSPTEAAFGVYAVGRYMWRLTDVAPLARPIPCTGQRGLLRVAPAVEAQIWEQIWQQRKENP